MILVFIHPSCNTEEGDKYLLLHTLDISKSFDRILTKTVDSDIVIITIAAFQKSPSIKELWIELGRGLYSSS